MVGTNDLEKSTSFYDKILAVLGLKKVTTTERYVGYSNSDDPEEVKFYITKPHDKKPASVGNGTMVALLADTNEIVDKFYDLYIEDVSNNPEGHAMDYVHVIMDIEKVS